MNFLEKNAVALIALIVAITGCYLPISNAVHKAAGVTSYDEVDATAIKIGGSNGSRLGPIIMGTCTPVIGAAVSVTASTTQPYDCAVTGAVSGDYVLTLIASSTASINQACGWSIQRSAASTTAGFITEVWFNGTGATGNPSTCGVASSTTYFLGHPRSTVPGL